MSQKLSFLNLKRIVNIILNIGKLVIHTQFNERRLCVLHGRCVLKLPHIRIFIETRSDDSGSSLPASLALIGLFSADSFYLTQLLHHSIDITSKCTHTVF